MARKKKREEEIEEVEAPIFENLAEELPESFEDLADDDSSQYSLEEETKIVPEITEEIEEEVVEEVIEEVVQAFVEFNSVGEIELMIPMRDHAWDDDVFVITSEYAEQMLNNASARIRNAYGKVAFAGHERQNRFLAFLATWMLKGEGNILYLPEELADYEPLQELEKLDDAPEGFVAFSAK